MNISILYLLCFSIRYFNLPKLYSEKQAISRYLENFHDIGRSCSKRLLMRNWDTMLESHGRLDKTMYGKSSVKVCRLRQLWSFFEFFTVLGMYTLSFFTN